MALGLLLAATRGAPAEPAAPSSAAPPAFSPGEEIGLTLEYLHLPAGRLRLVVGRPEGTVWPIICQARTGGAAMLLDIREHFVSYWDAEARASRGSDLNAIEIGDRHTDRARFDLEGGKARVQVTRKGKVLESSLQIPRGVQDLASALLYLRLQHLAPGARFEYPVFHGTSTFMLRAEVEGREKIDTPAGRTEALRIKLQLGFEGRFKSRRDAYVWLSEDLRHVPVRMTAEFSVGSMTATLDAYRPGGQLSVAR